MGKQLPVDRQVLQGNLIEDIPIVLVVLVKDQSDMRASELEIQGLLLTLLKGRLHVVMRSQIPQAAILATTAQFHKHLHHPRYLVLMEKQLQTPGSDGQEELNCDSLRVLAIDCRLPSLATCCQVASRVSGMLAGGAVYAVLELTHNLN
jgi:hypothetical protein